MYKFTSILPRTLDKIDMCTKIDNLSEYSICPKNIYITIHIWFVAGLKHNSNVHNNVYLFIDIPYFIKYILKK